MSRHREMHGRTVQARRGAKRFVLSFAPRPCCSGAESTPAKSEYSTRQCHGGKAGTCHYRLCSSWDGGVGSGGRTLGIWTPISVSEIDLKSVAIATLRSVASDISAPAAARAAAARTLLELLGEIGRLQVEKRAGSESPLGEMSAAELEHEIARLARLASPRGKAVYRLL